MALSEQRLIGPENHGLSMSHVICVSLATPQNCQHKHKIFFTSYYSDRTGCHRIMTHYAAFLKKIVCFVLRHLSLSLHSNLFKMCGGELVVSRLSRGIANGKVHGPRLLKPQTTYDRGDKLQSVGHKRLTFEFLVAYSKISTLQYFYVAQ